ncbi:MAG: glycosyltransferase family 2 protein [Pirellulales bacterium]
MLQIVVPMAGRGSRFAKVGYELPKPLIDVCGVPMIQMVVSNLRPKCDHRFIFLCLQEHLEKYPIPSILNEVAPNHIVVPVEGVTQGAACTVLLAHEYINSNDPLMIANSDQWVDFSIDRYLDAMEDRNLDGLIMTMWADDPKWSFVRLDDAGEITEVVEKKVVSNEATVGIYNFKRGRDFVSAAESMIEKDLRVNNEFYVAPAYNELIQNGQQIGYVNVGRERDGMYGIGIPEDLEYFKQCPVSSKAIAVLNRFKSHQRAA